MSAKCLEFPMRSGLMRVSSIFARFCWQNPELDGQFLTENLHLTLELCASQLLSEICTKQFSAEN